MSCYVQYYTFVYQSDYFIYNNFINIYAVLSIYIL